ncbi:hypothetical protein [Arthrobacter pityocampae]|uniref:hypothetical protein n=1 Tax=Arthrobacter pityocampae TaxID=547334 RepID=UPI0037357F55
MIALEGTEARLRLEEVEARLQQIAELEPEVQRVADEKREEYLPLVKEKIEIWHQPSAAARLRQILDVEDEARKSADMTRNEYVALVRERWHLERLRYALRMVTA